MADAEDPAPRDNTGKNVRWDNIWAGRLYPVASIHRVDTTSGSMLQSNDFVRIRYDLQ